MHEPLAKAGRSNAVRHHQRGFSAPTADVVEERQGFW